MLVIVIQTIAGDALTENTHTLSSARIFTVKKDLGGKNESTESNHT